MKTIKIIFVRNAPWLEYIPEVHTPGEVVQLVPCCSRGVIDALDIICDPSKPPNFIHAELTDEPQDGCRDLTLKIMRCVYGNKEEVCGFATFPHGTCWGFHADHPAIASICEWGNAYIKVVRLLQ